MIGLVSPPTGCVRASRRGRPPHHQRLASTTVWQTAIAVLLAILEPYASLGDPCALFRCPGRRFGCARLRRRGRANRDRGRIPDRQWPPREDEYGRRGQIGLLAVLRRRRGAGQRCDVNAAACRALAATSARLGGQTKSPACAGLSRVPMRGEGALGIGTRPKS